MQQKTNKILYAYWNEVRGSRIAPRRFEIEPARIGSILPETFILERVDAANYRYRLSGTRIFEEFGIEFRSTNFLDHWSSADRTILQRHLQELTTHGGTGEIAFTATGLQGLPVVFEAILLPLIHTHNVIDRFLGAISAINPPPWLGEQRLTERALVSHSIDCPSTAAPGATHHDTRQTPFLPHIRDARLVRSERRQFRVYDGGLSKADSDKR